MYSSEGYLDTVCCIFFPLTQPLNLPITENFLHFNLFNTKLFSMFLSHFNRLHAHGDNDALLLKSPPAIMSQMKFKFHRTDSSTAEHCCVPLCQASSKYKVLSFLFISL